MDKSRREEGLKRISWFVLLYVLSLVAIGAFMFVSRVVVHWLA